MGGVGTGAAFRSNLAALSAIRLRLRTVHGVKTATASRRLFGLDLSMPVMAAPMTGVCYNMGGAMSEEDFARELAEGAARAGVPYLCGDGADTNMYDAGLSALAGQGGRGGAIIKPRGQAEVIARLKRAEAAGAAVVGMDVDGAGLLTMALRGQPVGPKTPEEVREIVAATSLPFVVKGVMTPEEAETCFDVGAAGIVVSNHGGRVLDHTPGAAEVLPDIVARTRGRGAILVDGGVRTGADVLKLLALGADAALIGRPLAVAVMGGGAEGVALYLEKLRGELIQAMLLTGTADVSAAHSGILA